jgi:CrcB protein
MTALAVALGGGLGALSRYGLEGVIAPRQRSGFPLSTFLINMSGSAALGLLVGLVLANHVGSWLLPWIGTGFLGGYTTFSTFTYETLRLVEDAAWRQVAWNIALSGPASFAAAGMGFAIGRLR